MGELMVNPGAIKKNTQDIGMLSNLTTTEKGSLVGAVNELNGSLTNVETPTVTPNSTNTDTATSFTMCVWDEKIALVSMSVAPKIAYSANTNYVIGSFPEKYQPSGDRWGVLYDRANGVVAYVEVNSLHQITVRSSSQIQTSAVLRGEIVWFVGK